MSDNDLPPRGLPNIPTEDLLVELALRDEQLPPLRETPLVELMHEIKRRSDSSCCVAFRDYGERGGWEITAIGRGVMGPLLTELMFGGSECQQDDNNSSNDPGSSAEGE